MSFVLSLFPVKKATFVGEQKHLYLTRTEQILLLSAIMLTLQEARNITTSPSTLKVEYINEQNKRTKKPPPPKKKQQKKTTLKTVQWN